MERTNGYDLPFSIGRLKHRTDLIEQDEPLLSLYYNDNGDYYLLYWLDCDDHANRWMISRIDTKTLYEYLNREKSLLQVIKNPADNFVWITDIDGNGKQIHTQALPTTAIPEYYLPDADSKFEFGRQQELLGEVSTDNFEVDAPKSDKSLFSTIVSKMGWRLSPKSIRKLTDRVAL